MKQRLRFSLLLAAALLGVAAAVGVAIGRSAPPVRLADGSLMTLEGVTYGTEHEAVLGPDWAKQVRTLVPAAMLPRFDRWSGCRTFPHRAEKANTLVFWSYHRGIHPAVKGGELAWRTQVVTLSEDGATEQAVGYGSGNFFAWPPREVLEAWCLPVFPRRCKTVRVRASLQDATGRWVPVFEQSVPNPSHIPSKAPTEAPRSATGIP